MFQNLRLSNMRLRTKRALLALSLGAVSVVAMHFASGTASPPNIKPVLLSADPLYAPSLGDKPTIALALSVEYPSTGAQYYAPGTSGSTTDGSYANTTEYLGYYDSNGCYRYNDAPTETPASGYSTSDYKRFDRSGAATNRMCSDGLSFSGNFLNWATSSAIDTVRMALTGGDRYIDQPSLTILQRAVLSNGSPVDMWNSSDFPAKQLKYAGGSSGTNYFGAIPTSMANAAGQSDIWVANTLNRIYFGTAKGGSSSAPSTYNLSSEANPIQKGPQVVQPNPTSLPSDAVLLGTEYANYVFSGTREIWFGAGTKWTVLPAWGGIDCYWNGAGSSLGGIQDPASGVSKSCYSRAYSGSWAPTRSSGALNSEGYFYSRVNVCNVNNAGILQDVRDWGLCTQYPSGNYKPTGSIQKYSDSARLAAFGYLLDQTSSTNNGRYGAVLRAPMDYVGLKTFDEQGQENTPVGGNPHAAWNSNTGIFNVNPLGDTTFNKSGVITYLNQFGRTGTLGMYKQFDPVGELHYEALRYLQGLQPTPAAVSNISASMYDGFPVTTTWIDPYGGNRSSTADYSCSKSNIVILGDINTWDGNRMPPGNSSTPGWSDKANNVVDISYWRGIVQAFEKNQTSTSYVDGQGATRYVGNPNGSNYSVPSVTTGSQIIGSAYWAHTHDIRGTTWTNSTAQQRPGLRVKTFTFDVNEYGSQSNIANIQYSNQFYIASKYGGFQTDPANVNKDPYNTWGNPFRRDDGTPDDNVWSETDGNQNRTGFASSYFQGSTDARAILSAFDTIFARASTSARSIAGGAIQSKNLTQAGDTIYQGTFNTSDWSGDLVAIPVLVNTSNVVSIGSTTTWTAATQLAALSTPATTRNVVVGNSGATSNPVAVPFSWNQLSTTLQGYLNKATSTATADGLGSARVSYLLGDKSREGNPFRTRNSLMGDVINSGVIFSGDPSSTINSSTYSSFYSSHVGRTQAVYVGANDGMMHAFNASNGNELFAYIPSWLGPKLSLLTNSNYGDSHTSYVDGTPAVAEAELDSGWASVLVSGSGGGGRGVFALDVSDPSTFSASKVLWEFTNADDADLGYVVGRPQILKLRTSESSATTATYKWFAVVASGVNNYVADPISGIYSTTGNPALFFLDLSKPAGTAWTLGSNYFKISFPTNSTLNPTVAAGMLNFSPVLDGNGVVSKIFAGDLQGNMWKLDFTASGTTNWSLAKLSSFHTSAGVNSPIPLFIAKDNSGNVQQISAAPRIVAGQVIGSSYVLFGTGKYLEVADRTNTSTQSEYMIYDDGSGNTDSGGTGASAISGRSVLRAGTANATTGVVSVASFTAGLTSSSTPSTVRSGWYFDLPNAGERQVSNGTIVGTTIDFGSLIPANPTAGSTCTVAGGSGNIYTISFIDGNGTSIGSSVGILGEPLVATVTGATTFSTQSSTGRKIKTVVSQVFQQGSNGIAAGSTQTTQLIAGRLSWRQVNSYQNLKNAP